MMKLYTWWRSQASYRVRIALRLKGLDAEMIPVELTKGEQYDEKYRAVNPGMVVPALVDGDGPALVQSLAILEYLDERYPEPPLLPGDARERAYVRGLAHIICMDAHPFVVLRVRKFLNQEFNADDAAWMRWVRHWLDSATHVVEEQLSRDPRTGQFCCGDSPTLADICLVAHLTSTKVLYNSDLSLYPNAQRIFDTCMQLEAFSAAHPLRQPDAPKQS